MISDKPFCKPGQVKVYGVAKRERIHVSCDVIANPSQNLKFEWVFNSSSERLDVQENLIQTSGTRSVADHMPQVENHFLSFSIFVFLLFVSYHMSTRHSVCYVSTIISFRSNISLCLLTCFITLFDLFTICLFSHFFYLYLFVVFSDSFSFFFICLTAVPILILFLPTFNCKYKVELKGTKNHPVSIKPLKCIRLLF